MLKQIEEVKELRIPSLVFSANRNVILLIGKARYKLFSGDKGGLCKIKKK